MSGLTRERLELLPASVALLLLAAVTTCRHSPPPDWNEAAYTLVGRKDLALLCRPHPTPSPAPETASATPSTTTVNTETSSEEAEDGMEGLDTQVRGIVGSVTLF